jgi:hypothetical protein
MRAPSQSLSLAIGAVMAGLSGLFLLAQTDPRAAACLPDHYLHDCPVEHPYWQIGAALILASVVLGLLAFSAARWTRARSLT